MASEQRHPRVVLACDFLLRYAAGLAGGVAQSGCATVLLTRSHGGEFGGDAEAMRAYVWRALGDRARHLELAGRPSQLSALPAAWRVRRSVRRFGPEVVHLQAGILNDPRLLAVAGARPGRYALTIHDPAPHPGAPGRSSTRRQIQRRGLIGQAGVIFVHAEALREELIARHRPRAPVVVVPHGVEAPSAAPLPDRPALLFFGRITPYKGLDTLLDAMPEVWRQAPEVCLTVAGKGELPEHPVLEDRRVELRGEHIPEHEVPDLYARASCVVLPYRQASQSGVGSLARQYGRALVTTAVGGLPELVTADSGRVVAPEDPAALAAAMLEVVMTPGLAEAMGRAAAATVVDEAGWAYVGELTREAYQRHLLRGRAEAGSARSRSS